MTTKKIFSGLYKAPEDRDLVESLIIECIQIHGRDLYYLPRDLTNFDEFFGEDAMSSFGDAIALEFFLENQERWSGEGQFISKFGLELRDTATFVCAQRRFKEEITSKYPEMVRPREGDILVLDNPTDHRKRFMEITFVKNEEVFYEIGKLYVWTLTVKNFEYNGESFSTGIDEIDSYQTDYSITRVYQMASGSGSYTAGETVSQVNGYTGIVVSFDGTNLVLTACKGDYVEGVPFIGETSGTSRHVQSIETEVKNDTGQPDNDFINEQADSGLIDFSEKNLFTDLG